MDEGSRLADVPVTTLGLILLTASLVAMLTRRFHFPYSIGLVAAGYGLGFLPQIVQVVKSPAIMTP